jgi:lipopolysaccharide export system permease protein
MIIQRLIIKKFIRIFFATLFSAVALFTLVDLLDHIGSFIDQNAPTSLIARYYMYRALWTADISMPIGMLMATLFTVGDMSRYNETTALFASGRSLMQITRPLLIAALFMTVFSFFWGEYVVSYANSSYNHIWEVELHGRQDRAKPTSDIASHGNDDFLYYARTFVPTRDFISGFRALKIEDSVVTQRFDSNEAEWINGQWQLREGTHRVFTSGSEKITPFDDLESGLKGITPEGLKREQVRAEDMNTRQLLRMGQLVETAGGDATAYNVDLQFKFAFPVVHLVVVFLGILLASGNRKTTVAAGFGWTIMVSFAYYLAMHFGQALGHNGAMPPVVAAWSGNIIYGLIGIIIHTRLRR